MGYNFNYSTDTYNPDFAEEQMLQMFSGIFTFMVVISFILSIIYLIATWRLIKKAGYQGWECLIPFYSTYVMFDVIYGNGWKMLMMLIPLVGPFYGFYSLYKFALVYNRGSLFGIGMIFLSPIFAAIMAFDNKSDYIGPSSKLQTNAYNPTYNPYQYNQNPQNQYDKYQNPYNGYNGPQNPYDNYQNTYNNKP